MHSNGNSLSSVGTARLTVVAGLAMLAMIGAMPEEEPPQLFGDIHIPSDMESLSLTRERQQHLCQREVPVVFFQTRRSSPHRGNGSTIFYNRIEVCCLGYRRDPYSGRCVPDCSQSSPDNCFNGFCRAPGRCECFAEFVRNAHGACIHTCPISCQNGRCYLNGTCACHPGYALDRETRLYCRPQCSQACGTHEECVAPGLCDCSPGYRRTDELGCQPICTPDCGYGKCVAPNQCECFPGFIKRPQRSVCEAECHINCENGFCESRYKCQCREGYRYDLNTTSCLPECVDDCGHGNGVCIAPGVCRCFEGHEGRGNGCHPKCDGSCGPHGLCLEPNICGCRPSQQHCLNGSCDASGHCSCPNGQTHFVDRCLKPPQLIHQFATNERRLHFNQQLSYEFSALIGRHFNLG
ncbi:von Willebrand factor D and EGF domain-containing protein isoform X1 [Drosophila obscura]|uniref:von Willebrand factor D and EGF domain-containing protein isoform X1 n=1 Tax=Drosophila obscura TaxID=7282 RepID=UPI001BB24DD1|nr:von Willebrand factor D and EGF domain-containing protein isoform X1 [Drosophila obscura]